MNALYGLYPDAESAQRAFDALRAASSELKFNAVGGTSGYLLTTISQKSYPIHTGGMSLTPAWTNGIIVYEMIMLGAILTTLVVLLIGAGLPNFKAVITDPEVGKGKILVGVVDPPQSSQPELERRLQLAGASQVKQSGGTL
jgi:hypothetical protein